MTEQAQTSAISKRVIEDMHKFLIWAVCGLLTLCMGIFGFLGLEVWNDLKTQQIHISDVDKRVITLESSSVRELEDIREIKLNVREAVKLMKDHLTMTRSVNNGP